MLSLRALRIRLAAWWALLAVVLQLAAMPLASAHMIKGSLAGIGAELITICTPHGSQNLLVGEDGQPIKPGKPLLHCVFCLAAGASPLLLQDAAVADADGGNTTGMAVAAIPLPQDAGSLWPFGHGPPA